jgi:hypothetical protein
MWQVGNLPISKPYQTVTSSRRIPEAAEKLFGRRKRLPHKQTDYLK